MVVTANLTVNQSIELDYMGRASYPVTIALLRKSWEDLGYITCEIDGLFENLLMTFFLNEPKRLEPLMDTMNNLIRIYDEHVGNFIM